MSSQPEIGQIPSAIAHAPGVPVIRNVNWGGLRTLYVKEVRRFFKVQLQTVWAPHVFKTHRTPHYGRRRCWRRQRRRSA